MTRQAANPHVEAVRRMADKYVSRDGGKPSDSARRNGKPRIDRQAALALISDAEEQLRLRRIVKARECLKLLRKLIWEARA
jgi:hypothetical protein